MMIELSRRQNAWLQRCLRLAAESQCNYRHCALVIKSGKVLSAKNNRWRTVMPTTTPLSQDDVKTLTYHAEYRAIKAVGLNNCRGATIVVARVSNTGPKLSKPCADCQKLIDQVGIRKVIYSR